MVKSKWQQEFDGLPEWARKMVGALERSLLSVRGDRA